MNANTELLNFIYQNSQMGVDTVRQLMDITENADFQKLLSEHLEGYQKVHEKAWRMLNENGYDEKGLSAFAKNPYVSYGQYTDYEGSFRIQYSCDADTGKQYGDHRSPAEAEPV